MATAYKAAVPLNTDPRLNVGYLSVLAFCEGGAVMVAELASAKMVAPFFGSSMYVWAAVLGVTLGGLAGGYYLGGFLSQKRRSSLLFTFLLTAGALLVIMPYLGEAVMGKTINFPVQQGTLISLFVFLFPALLLLGSSSPLIIRLITTDESRSGKNAGFVFAFSTVGGIFATFLAGFYLLPSFGIKLTTLICGGLLSLISLPGFLKNFSVLKFGVVAVLFFTSLLTIVEGAEKRSVSADHKIIYAEEGVLGQVKVIDQMFPTHVRGWRYGRVLMVNNTSQSIMDLTNPPNSLWDWSYMYAAAASIMPPGSSALLMGLGGGSLVHNFQQLGFKVRVVELDERVREVAQKYFYLDPQVPVIIDDARHFINTESRTYDVIMLDLFLNETPPSHVLTKESFLKLKKLLTDKGLLLINFYGFVSGEEGVAARSVYRTLKSCGYHLKVAATPGEEAHRNLMFLASKEEKDFTAVKFSAPELPVITDLSPHLLGESHFTGGESFILQDDSPKLELLYRKPAVKWRETMNDLSTKKLVNNKMKMIF